MHSVLRWDMVLGREEMVSALFRETDRAQRMKMPLALIKVGIVAWEGGRAEPGDPAFDSVLREIVARITPLLRCYDAVGQMAEREFLLVLPGCSIFNARTLAERLRDEVFGASAPACAAEMRLPGLLRYCVEWRPLSVCGASRSRSGTSKRQGRGCKFDPIHCRERRDRPSRILSARAPG